MLLCLQQKLRPKLLSKCREDMLFHCILNHISAKIVPELNAVPKFILIGIKSNRVNELLILEFRHYLNVELLHFLDVIDMCNALDGFPDFHLNQSIVLSRGKAQKYISTDIPNGFPFQILDARKNKVQINF